MVIKDETIKYLKSLNFDGFNIKISKQLTECKKVLISIGMVESNSKNTYISEIDLSSILSDVLDSGEFEEKFIGIELSKNMRLSKVYKLEKLRKTKSAETWELIACKSNPFKLIPSVHEKLLNLKSQMEDKIGDLKTYYVKISDKVSFSKVDHQSQWYVKTNCYPLGLGLTLWHCIEDLLELDRSVSVEEYEQTVDKACKLILEAEISDKIPLKSKVENADNSITEEE